MGRVPIACLRASAAAAHAIAMAATAASPAAAPGSDPLRAPECHRALAALEAEEGAAEAAPHASAGAVARPAPPNGLQAARRHAAQSCLASRADAPLPSGRLARPPIVVAPLRVAPAGRTAAAHPAPAGPTPPVPERPYAVTSCDPGGCWANDGSRLNRVGPNLWGAHGICTLQGTLLQCP
jgi:hypothetical protein